MHEDLLIMLRVTLDASFTRLRNGLAHTYDPNPIVVGNETVRLVLAWKGDRTFES